MTLSEFDTLRSDLAGLRSDIDARISGLRTDIEAPGRTRTDTDVRFAAPWSKSRREARCDCHLQAALGMFTGMFAVMIGTVVVLKAIEIIH